MSDVAGDIDRILTDHCGRDALGVVAPKRLGDDVALAVPRAVVRVCVLLARSCM